YNLIEPRGNFRQLARFIIWTRSVNKLRHFYERIQSNYIGSSEGRGLRSSNCRTGERINFINTQFQFFCEMKNLHHCIYSSSVGNECGSVFAENCSFSQEQITVVHEEINHLRRSFFSGYYFKKPQVPRRVEEVRTAEMFLEV